MSFPQAIMGKYGWEKVTTSAQKQKLGTHMQIFDREFVYVKAGEDLTAGKLIDGMAGTAAHQVDLAVSAASAVLPQDSCPRRGPSGPFRHAPSSRQGALQWFLPQVRHRNPHMPTSYAFPSEYWISSATMSLHEGDQGEYRGKFGVPSGKIVLGRRNQGQIARLRVSAC